MTGRDHALVVLLALLAADTAPARGSDGVLGRVASRATAAVADIVDPDAIIERVDVEALLGRIDIDVLLDRVDLDAVLARVDINDILDRVDIDRLLDRIDINWLLDEVDIDRLMARIDVDAIVAQVDVKEVAERAGIPDIVRESTGELAGSAVDVLRRQIVAIDTIASSTAYRLTGRDPSTRPVSPPSLEVDADTGRKGRGRVTGFYAGPLSRLGAFLIDVAIVWFSFVLTIAGITFIVDVFSRGETAQATELGPIGFAVIAIWAFLYMWASLTIAGRTLGMGIVGIRVVNRQGGPLSPRQALIRTVVFPFSFLIFGLGFLGIFISPERRTMHDAAAGSVVVYDWGDRPAEMSAPLTKWVSRRAEELAAIDSE
jgi:uncharacterized RDD family membrane protein YckC